MTPDDYKDKRAIGEAPAEVDGWIDWQRELEADIANWLEWNAEQNRQAALTHRQQIALYGKLVK